MTQTAEPTADQLRTDALRGPWQAVLSDRYGFVYTDADDARENAEDEDEELTVSVVRGTAAPADRGGCRMRLPGSNQCGDEAYAIEAFLDDDDPSVGAEVRLIQAQAMAAGLNAAAAPTAFDLAAYIADSGISHTGPWWNLRFPSGAAMNVHAALTPPCTVNAEIEEAPGAEMTTVDGLTTEQVWAHAARLAVLPPACLDAAEIERAARELHSGNEMDAGPYDRVRWEELPEPERERLRRYVRDHGAGADCPGECCAYHGPTLTELLRPAVADADATAHPAAADIARAEQQALIQMVIDALPPAADETLWAVHIQGSDDIVPQPTREAANKVKAQLDAYDESNAHRKDFPKASAVVVEWPYAREEHARHLADEAASTDAF